MNPQKNNLKRRLTLTMHEENEIKESKQLMNSLIVDANVYKQEREILQEEYKEKKLEHQTNIDEMQRIQEQQKQIKKKKKTLEKVKKQLEQTPLQQFKSIKSVQKNYGYVVLLLEAYIYIFDKEFVDWNQYKKKIDVKKFKKDVLSLDPKDIKKQCLKTLKSKFFENPKWNIERMKKLPLYHSLAEFLQLIYRIAILIGTLKPQKKRLSILQQKVEDFENLQQSQVKDFNSIVRKEKGTYELLNAFRDRIKKIIQNSQQNQKNLDEILYDKNNFNFEILEDMIIEKVDKSCQVTKSMDDLYSMEDKKLFEYINSEDEEISLELSKKQTAKNIYSTQTFSKQLQLSKNQLFQQKTFCNDNSTENFSQRLSYFEKEKNEKQQNVCQMIVDVMNQSDSQIDNGGLDMSSSEVEQKRSATSDINLNRKKDQYVSYLFVHSQVTKNFWKDKNSFFHTGDTNQNCFYRKIDPKLIKSGQYKQPESYREEIFKTGKKTLNDKVTRVSDPVFSPRLSQSFINNPYQPKKFSNQ